MSYSATPVSMHSGVGPAPAPMLTLYHHGRQSRPVDNLLYLQSFGNYTWLVWQDGQRILMPRTLKYVQERLPADWFVRLHRNCVVNRMHILCLERTVSGLDIRLRNGTTLPIARRRCTAVRHLLEPASLIRPLPATCSLLS